MKLSFTSTIIKGGAIFLAIFVLNSCGEGIGGGGGGGGAKETGIYFNVDSIAPRDDIPAKDTSSIDITWNQDCTGDGSTTTTDIEPFGAHTANVTLSASRVAGAANSPLAGNWVQITRYTVDFALNSGSTGPSFSSKEYGTTIKVSVGSTATANVNLMPLEFKKTYVSALGGSSTWDNTWYPLYTVTYTFYGQDDLGRSVSAKEFQTVSVGHYNNCS